MITPTHKDLVDFLYNAPYCHSDPEDATQCHDRDCSTCAEMRITLYDVSVYNKAIDDVLAVITNASTITHWDNKTQSLLAVYGAKMIQDAVRALRKEPNDKQ